MALLPIIEQYFRDQGWSFKNIPGEAALELGYQGQNGRWPCVAQAREDLQQFIFYAICPNNCPQERRVAMAEFQARANYGLLIGNFELDFRDGEVRYKASIDVENDRLTDPLCHHLVVSACSTLDRYLPGLLKVMYGQVDPSMAIAEIEAAFLPPAGDA
jgi:hypothetical protein